MNDIIWEGIVEKKGRDFFSRWNKRKLIIIGDECRYFDLDGVSLRGVIRLVESTVISVNANVVLIKTVGRPDKKKGNSLEKKKKGNY